MYLKKLKDWSVTWFHVSISTVRMTLGGPDPLVHWPCASTSGTSFPDSGSWTTSWTPSSAADGPCSSCPITLSNPTGAATNWTSPTSGSSTPVGMWPSWSCWSHCPWTTSLDASANCAKSWAPPPTWSGLRRRRGGQSSGGVYAMFCEETTAEK